MTKAELKLLIDTFADRKLSGRCLTFGVQGIDATFDTLFSCFSQAGYIGCDLDKVVTDDLPPGPRADLPHQDQFFRMLGCSEVESLDYYPNENPTHVTDLNVPVQETFMGRYDFVFDGGTTEHCFNIKEVLFNVVRLLAPKGRVVHLSPIFAGFRHGYYNFSPDLFFEFYGQNSFTNMEARILVIEPGLRAYWFKYSPGDYLPESLYGKYAMILFVAQKSESSGPIIVPLQSVWHQKFNPDVDMGGVAAVGARERRGIKNILRYFPWLYEVCRELWQRFRFARLVQKNWIVFERSLSQRFWGKVKRGIFPFNGYVKNLWNDPRLAASWYIKSLSLHQHNLSEKKYSSYVGVVEQHLSGDKVLGIDLGCGIFRGSILFMRKHPNARFVGVDYSDYAYAHYLKREYPAKTEFILSDVRNVSKWRKHLESGYSGFNKILYTYGTLMYLSAQELSSVLNDIRGIPGLKSVAIIEPSCPDSPDLTRKMDASYRHNYGHYFRKAGFKIISEEYSDGETILVAGI